MPPKPKLTPEEKKELRAQKKAEKKLKQVEKKKQLKRDLLERELKYGAVTLKRQEHNWRKMLIDITVPEMRKDLEFAWHNFERIIDCKDFTISLLLDELNKASDQYFLNLKTHTEHIDMLVKMFEDRMYELHSDYREQFRMPPKPKLAPEEKKELRAQKKAEKKLKQVEKKKQLKRDLLERELKYGAVTLKRQEHNWRKMLIDITVPEMRKDLEFAWHNFERIIDCKDFTISLLLDELNKASDQYFLNLKTHTEHIDMLVKMFEDRMYELHSDYREQTRALQTEHEKTLEQMSMETSEEENYIKTMLHILQLEMKEVKRTRHADYFSKLEEQDSKQNQVIQRIRGILEQAHLQLWTDTISFLGEYGNKIKERKKMHNELKTEDDRLQNVIKKQLEHIRKAYNTIRGLKIKKTELEKFLGRKVADLQSESDFFTMAFDTLKAKLAGVRELDFQKLSCLTVNYNDVVSYLEDLETKGKHILHVGTVCRKLETLQEKILPYPSNFLNEVSRPSVNEVKEYMAVLELFWQRVGQADATRYAVNEEREFLITENDILKQRLHQYCQCLKCPNYEPFTTKARPCFTVTEGTLELKKYSKQGTMNGQFESVDANNSLGSISWTDSPFEW